jgi:hypothetical protein
MVDELDENLGLEESEDEKHEREIKDKYRALFSSGIGVEVLADFLALCHFGSTLDADNKMQVAEYNVGIALLARCGVLQADNFESVIRALLGLRGKRK